MLIRPDACIAWAGDDGSTDGLEEALDRWFKSGFRGAEQPGAPSLRAVS
jgi:hypothetical protein